MKMYVANASIQRHEFIYRIPEQRKERRLTIEPMSQVRLADDLNQGQIDDIVEQHEKYGFVPVEEVKSVKKRFTRLCYSIDKPISSFHIELLSRTNISTLDDFGKEMRKQTAIASNEAVSKVLADQREQQGLEADVNNFEMTIQEEEPSGGYDRPTSEVIAEGFKVETKTNQPAVQTGRRRRS